MAVDRKGHIWDPCPEKCDEIKQPDGEHKIIILEGEAYWKWPDGGVSIINKTEARRLMLQWGYGAEETIDLTNRLFATPKAGGEG